MVTLPSRDTSRDCTGSRQEAGRSCIPGPYSRGSLGTGNCRSRRGLVHFQRSFCSCPPPYRKRNDALWDLGKGKHRLISLIVGVEELALADALERGRERFGLSEDLRDAFLSGCVPSRADP